MKLFKVKEVAEILGRPVGSIRNSISRGQINTVKILGSTMITKEELERLTGLKYEDKRGGFGKVLFRVELFGGNLMVNLKQLYDLFEIAGTNEMKMKIFYNDIEIRDEYEAKNICMRIIERGEQ